MLAKGPTLPGSMTVISTEAPSVSPTNGCGDHTIQDFLIYLLVMVFNHCMCLVIRVELYSRFPLTSADIIPLPAQKASAAWPTQ